MPRIIQSNGDPLDFCIECFMDEYVCDEDVARELYGNEELTGSGPDGRGNCFAWDAEHPTYDDNDCRCTLCGAVLTSDDDYK
jgi:hypothetical protein